MKNLLTTITLHAILFSMAIQYTSNTLAAEQPKRTIKFKPIGNLQFPEELLNKPGYQEIRNKLLPVNFDNKQYIINVADKEKLEKTSEAIAHLSSLKSGGIAFLSPIFGGIIGTIIGDTTAGVVGGIMAGLAFSYCIVVDQDIANAMYKKEMHNYLEQKQAACKKEYLTSIQKLK